MVISQPADREATVGEVVDALVKTFMAMRDASVPAWLHLELTMAQLKCIFLLATKGTMTVGELGTSLGIGRPAASVLVDHLVQLALVRREEDPEDRRRTLVYLTPRGLEVDTQLRQGNMARLREWLGRLNEDDLAALCRGLRALFVTISGEEQQTSQIDNCPK